MENKKPATPGKKQHPAVFVGIIVVVLLVLGASLFVAKGKSGGAAIEEVAVIEQPAETLPTGTAADVASPAVEPMPEPTPEATAQATPPEGAASPVMPASIDVNAALSDRILGDASAPIKISEHSSLTCGHCSAFHRETFEQVKKDYIDTGKAYIVFSDFPLNEPALRASMAARCLPEDKYFDFVQMLFVKQQDWAYDAGYLDYLKNAAGEAGLDAAHFDACVENKELEDGIKNRMKGIQAQWNISSTPSFVINNRNTISGALPYEEFKKALDAEATGGEKTGSSPTPAPAPAAEETKAPAVEPAAAESEEDGAPAE